MRIGIFGGTFNPVHFGHLRVAEEARELARLDTVFFMPAGNPPLKESGVLDAETRFLLTAAAISSNPGFALIDTEVLNPAKSYTVSTIAGMTARHPGDTLFFMLGTDAFLDIPRWHDPFTLTASIDFIILARPGYSPEALRELPFLTSPDIHEDDSGIPFFMLAGGRRAYLLSVTQLSISSEDIRRRIREGRSIRYLVPGDVARIIGETGAYRNGETEVPRKSLCRNAVGE